MNGAKHLEFACSSIVLERHFLDSIAGVVKLIPNSLFIVGIDEGATEFIKEKGVDNLILSDSNRILVEDKDVIRRAVCIVEKELAFDPIGKDVLPVAVD